MNDGDVLLSDGSVIAPLPKICQVARAVTPIL